MRIEDRILVLFIPVLSCLEIVRKYSIQLCVVNLNKEGIQRNLVSKVQCGSILAFLQTQCSLEHGGMF